MDIQACIKLFVLTIPKKITSREMGDDTDLTINLLAKKYPSIRMLGL